MLIITCKYLLIAHWTCSKVDTHHLLCALPKQPPIWLLDTISLKPVCPPNHSSYPNQSYLSKQSSDYVFFCLKTCSSFPLLACRKKPTPQHGPCMVSFLLTSLVSSFTTSSSLHILCLSNIELWFPHNAADD